MTAQTQDAPAAVFAEPGTQLPPDTRLRADSTIEWLPANTIGQDPRVNTREVDYGWVAAQSKPGVFKWDYLGTIAVSQRDGGARISVDGQHRIALVTAVGAPDVDLKCEVFRGLSLADEAGLFLGLNASRTIRPVSKFLARVTMGDPLCSEVLRIVENRGWQITATPGRGVLSCVKAMERIHTADTIRNGRGGDEPQALHDALTLITSAWGQHEQAGHESLISGLGKLLVRDGGIIRQDRTSGVAGMDRLLGVLCASGEDPSGLLQRGRSFSGTRVPPVSLPTAIAQVLTQSWNTNKQTHRLPPFVA